MAIKISLDSGAFSLFMKHGKGLYKSDFHKEKWFKEYLDSYIEFLCGKAHYFNMYVTLDVIHNGRATDEILKYMESYGLRPLPVLHFGADYSLVKRYVENYEYICLGGMGGRYMSSKKLVPFLDSVFEVARGQKGRMTKVHGLAVTADSLLLKYPWYSVDAATWFKASAYGQILFLHKKKNSVRLGRYYITPDAPRTRHIVFSYGKGGSIYNTVEKCAQSLSGFSLSQLASSRGARRDHNLRVLLDLQEVLKAHNKDKHGLQDWGDILIAGDPMREKEVRKVAREKKYECTVHLFETFFSTGFKKMSFSHCYALAEMGYRLNLSK